MGYLYLYLSPGNFAYASECSDCLLAEAVRLTAWHDTTGSPCYICVYAPLVVLEEYYAVCQKMKLLENWVLLIMIYVEYLHRLLSSSQSCCWIP